ncbi:MAG: hypothetical protein EOS71_00525 [Mesorhizobium sp.]|nr:hypothetical protein EOA35_00675 [Mesorhizobium sp. M8A.F.Ca.ET.023.01.1.1]RWC77763.1 MAG: hypothetical protein EOS71_00525 [Mesorhizobium sp.]TIS98756.1 MAG: hypothetical protein E5W88_05005 [Mesorhizobium sp.]TIW85876.1 MAG: hypothetical protein E5V51_15030 [Mesorhizobium sp.]
MKRAYVFVLRDKQREIYPEIERRYDAFQSLQDEDPGVDYVPGSVDSLRFDISRQFGIVLELEEMWDILYSAEAIAGVVAGKMLDANPPENMIPPSGR